MVNVYQSVVFTMNTRNGVDAKSRIQDIEEGVDTAGIDIIQSQNPYEIQRLGLELIRSAQKEIRIIEIALFRKVSS
jgi:hypothetical protein